MLLGGISTVGSQRVHFNVDMDEVPLLGQYFLQTVLPRLADTFDGNQILNEDPSLDEGIPELVENNLVTAANVLLGFTNEEPALWDIHTALCPLVM